MSVTINVTDLSIVHQGSGGEANASEPDVCKTTVGPAVKEICYENNAKSADLADGSVTVFADGGNSIACLGSIFASSVGDADGDQKGVDSGTIESFAQFTSAACTVTIEGRGVSRLSDTMTMNAENTICSGVQNPSVTVDPVLEVPSSIDICVRYPNGKPFKNAAFVVADESGAPKGAGTLDASGKSNVNGLKPGKIKLKASESADPFEICPIRRKNPHFEQEAPHDDFFALATKGQQGFWQPVRVETGLAPWGSIGKELSSDRFFQDIVELETKLHFEYQHPDSAFTLGKTCDVVIGNLNMPLPHTTECMLAYCMPLMLEEGEILSVLLRLASYETTDRMTAFMRARGEGNPLTYLQNYDWSGTQKQINESFANLLKKIESRIVFLRDEASKLKYSYLSEDIFDKHIDTLKAYTKGLPELISMSFTKMQLKATALLADSANVNVTKDDDNVYSTEAGDINKVVNTTQTIDTVEPFMNLVAGKIDNVIPIYPVRYGYANFFDEILPAQAPPTLPEMAAASGLKETGGYLLRLLRAGWVYIKEEDNNEQFHIFKCLQTEVGPDVVEQYQKYYFTNEENAQDGLTHDQSSGSDFYPFAFVTANTGKISIAYSEHEWSADIIDKMNGDPESRAKAMQQVDLNASDEFNEEATEANLSQLVEDYRTQESKWLANKDEDKPTAVGLEITTTTKSYHLLAHDLVDIMQESHSQKKNGRLVVLFDPIGRQTDLAYLLTQLTLWEEKDRSDKLYPREIAKILNHSFLSPEAPDEIRNAANENLDIESLEEFNNETEKLESIFSDRRESLLDLYAAFAYQDLADGSVGSLDTYLKMFFDIEAVKYRDPENEVEKLAGLIENLFSGVGASVEGHAFLIDLIDHAYQNDENLQNSNNIYFLLTEQYSRILTQCQNGADWGEMTKRAPEVFKNLWVNAQATYIYREKLPEQQKSKLSPKSVEHIAKSLLPTISQSIFGISLTGKTVKVQLSELFSMLAEYANPGGGKNMPKFNWQDPHLDWAKKLMSRKKILDKGRYVEQVFELPEIKFEWTPLIDGKAQVGPISSAAGIFVGGAITVYSWYCNHLTLELVLAQSQFDAADPIAGSKVLSDRFNLLGALGAIAVDTASLTHSLLVISERSLQVKSMSSLSTKVLPKITVGKLKLDRVLNARMTGRLIGVANLAVAVSEIMQTVDSYKSGDTGGAVAHATLGASAATFAISALGYIRVVSYAVFISLNVVGFLLLAIGVTLTWLFSKSHIENLLFSCFWGKDEHYPFWKFENYGYVTIENRLLLSTKFSPNMQAALQIEVQEFINLLLHPSVEVEQGNGIFDVQKKIIYHFKLPGFILGESEIIGSVQRDVVDIMQPRLTDIQKIEFDREGTEAFTIALENALQTATLKDGLLEMSVEVTLHKDAHLYWYYQPRAEIITPRRILTQNGLATQAYIGMKDGNLL